MIQFIKQIAHSARTERLKPPRHLSTFFRRTPNSQ